jgi:hypothetical protein
MDISSNFSNSFEYAKKLFSDGGRLVILVILNIIPIVNWILIGYASKVLREAPASDAPPKLEGYGDLFLEGAKVFFAGLIYMIIPLAIIGAGMSSMLPALFMGGRSIERGRFLLGGAGLGLILAGAILAFFVLIILGAAIAHMVKKGKFGKAFAFGEILDVIRGIGIGKYLVWVVFVAIISALIGALTGAIPFVGWLIGAIIAPAIYVFFFRSMGILYSDTEK